MAAKKQARLYGLNTPAVRARKQADEMAAFSKKLRESGKRTFSTEEQEKKDIAYTRKKHPLFAERDKSGRGLSVVGGAAEMDTVLVKAKRKKKS